MSRSRHLLAICLVLAAVVPLVGCGDSGDASTSTVTETITDSSSTATDTTSTEATTDDGSPPPADQQVNELTPFTSPSGNIGCYIDKKSVRCDIDKRDWEPPARPASCNESVDYGQGIQLAAGGAPEFVCAGDTALGGGNALPYGQSIAAGLLRCESSESGMSCRDIETGRGFSLSIQGYELFR